MDPRHRDRVAFVRVCSGRFTKDMVLFNSRVGNAAAGVARVPLLRPRSRDDQRGLRRRHHRPRQPGAVRDRRHAPHRRAGAVPRSAALSGRALRPRPPAGHALQAVRRRAAAARGRRADAGVLRRRRPPRADRRRRRRAAVRRHRQPPAQPSTASRSRSSRTSTRRHDGLPIRARQVPSLGGQARPSPTDRQERRVLLFSSEWELQYFERQHPAITLLPESPPVGVGQRAG